MRWAYNLKRNIIEISIGVLIGVIAYYLYISFLGVMFVLTVKAFSLTRKLNQGLRTALFWPFIISSDLVTSIPVFLVIGSLFGIVIKEFRWHHPFIVFCVFFSMFLISGIPFSAPYPYEILRFIVILLLIVSFIHLGLSVKNRRQRLKLMAHRDRTPHH
jgi:hypothetical protein